MFKDRLKELRMQAGVTQTELAQYLGVSIGTIGNYETGTRFPKDAVMWKKLAEFFHTTIDDLMDVKIAHDNQNNLETLSPKEEVLKDINKKLRTFDLERLKGVKQIIDIIYQY